MNAGTNVRTRCALCGAEIIWVRTKSGEIIPVDKNSVSIYLVEDTNPTGVVNQAMDVLCIPTLKGNIPHYLTCRMKDKTVRDLI